jgi:phage-related minor tail protein
MRDDEGFDDLGQDADALNQTLGQTCMLVSGFDSELRRMSTSLAATGKDVATLEKGLSSGLRKAFDGVVFDGMKLSDALSTIATSLSNTAYNAAIKPVANHFGGMLSTGIGGLLEGLLPFANGAPFSAGRVMPFADGGIVSQATHFGMRGGTGVTGEAGPEAIMPLARGADGKLGVKAGGGAGGAPTIIMNISTPDVAGFQRSRGQIAAQMGRALSAGQKNR